MRGRRLRASGAAGVSRQPLGRTAAALVLTLSAALLAHEAAAGADPPAAVIAGKDAKERIAAALEMKKTDAGALAKSLSALGASKAKDAEREFLTQYALQERDRALRFVALEALSRLDRKAAADWFRSKVDPKEELASVVSLEAVGVLGTKDDLPFLVGLIKSPNELVAIAATNAAGRFATSKDLEVIADHGLTHASDHITDHTAWVVQDVLKKPKKAAEWYEKFTKKSDPRSIRASATIAMLQDNLAEPHDWGETLTSAKDLVFAAPATIEIKSADAEYKKNAAAAMDWLKNNMPGADLLVRAAAKRIDLPGKEPDGFVSLDEEVIQVPATFAIQPPHKLAFHFLEMGTVLWMKRTGAPAKSHRGWEPALFDAFDLAVIARLYDAGRGYSRSAFMKDQVGKHPWGSQ